MKNLIACLLLSFTGLVSAAPQVELQTNFGNITIELYPEKAPASVKNFLSYAQSGFYDGTIFHRVINNFMIQGGGNTTDYERKETRDPIPNEADNGLKNLRGTVAMARTSDPNSATSQFFINTNDNDFLDYSSPTPKGWGYTVFGKVIAGMDVVDTIQELETGAGGPFTRSVPKKMVIIEKVLVQEKASATKADTAAKKITSPETTATKPAEPPAETEKAEASVKTTSTVPADILKHAHKASGKPSEPDSPEKSPQ